MRPEIALGTIGDCVEALSGYTSTYYRQDDKPKKNKKEAGTECDHRFGILGDCRSSCLPVSAYICIAGFTPLPLVYRLRQAEQALLFATLLEAN